MTEVTREAFAKRFARVAGGLSDEDLGTLVRAFEVHQTVAGEALIAENTSTDALFLVWEGELDVAVATPTGDGPVGRAGPGSFVGEVSLLDPGPATATVTSEQGGTALRLTRARFDHLCSSHPRIGSALLSEICRTLAARLRAGVELLDVSLAGHAADAVPLPLTEELIDVHAVLNRGGV